MNRSLKLIDMGDYFTPVDFEYLRKFNAFNIFAVIALACLPFVMLFVISFVILLFQTRRSVGSWTLAFKVLTRKIAQSSETSSPP